LIESRTIPSWLLSATLPLLLWTAAAHAAQSRAVLVEFQPISDADAGIAYLLYSTISESLVDKAGSAVAAGEDVEMFLGSSATTCRDKQACLDKVAEEFDASAAIFARISREGTDIHILYEFVSCATGRQLDGGEVTYEAGDEGQFADLLNRRLESNLAAAEREEDGDFDDYGSASATAAVDPDDDVDWEEERDHADAYADPYADTDADPDEDAAADPDETGDDRRYDAAESDYDLAFDGDYDAEIDAGDDPSRADSGYDSDYDRTSDYERTVDDDADEEDDDSAAAAGGPSTSRYSARQYLRDGAKEPESSSEPKPSPREERERRTANRYSRDSEEDAEEAQQQPRQTRGGRRKPKHPEDHEDATAATGRDIAPELLETFDDEDSALFDETERSGTATLTYQEASEKGMGPSEYKKYSSSGLTYGEWSRERYNHKGRFHIRFGGFYALGGIDSYYSARVVMWDETDILDTYYWQSFGFSAVGGGGTLGLGIGVAPAVDLSLDASLVVGRQWLLRQSRTPDSTESTITNVDPADIPKGTAVHFLIEPKVRVYFTPYRAVKPYAGFGLALLFMPPFDVPEEWVPPRSTTVIFGLEPALGIQFDSPLGFGFFIETPFTGYLPSKGVETVREGEQHVLLDDELNDPPTPVPMYMFRLQLGLQVRM